MNILLNFFPQSALLVMETGNKFVEMVLWLMIGELFGLELTSGREMKGHLHVKGIILVEHTFKFEPRDFSRDDN